MGWRASQLVGSDSAVLLEHQRATLAAARSATATREHSRKRLAFVLTLVFSVSKFNAFSAGLLRTVSADFRQHVKTLADMRRELDNVYRRIRALKLLLARLK